MERFMDTGPAPVAGDGTRTGAPAGCRPGRTPYGPIEFDAATMAAIAAKPVIPPLAEGTRHRETKDGGDDGR